MRNQNGLVYGQHGIGLGRIYVHSAVGIMAVVCDETVSSDVGTLWSLCGHTVWSMEYSLCNL